MGGKHKQAQRIKNNARPSSSGRSAELLASTSQAPQFSPKEIRFVPPTLSLMKTEEFDSSVSPAFQIVFKKMNKKDCTTKIKALQEFSDLIMSSEAEAVKTILAFWATLYAILVTDADHRVREAVHNAHHQIILKDKKIIAPYLKQIIGAWFTSQYDNYPPAASAAAKAFTAAFPPNKVQDCVLFCQKEILTYIYDNLTSKIDPKNTSDDAEAKFERIIVSSLQGYCLYLDTLSDEQIEKTTDLNKQIITNSRFLKLATHKAAIIRATWFKVLATLYHKAPFLLKDEHSQFVPIIFNNLDESEPAVVAFVWEAALLVMELGQEWWKHIQVEKGYLTKLKKVLREGGQGNAGVIYPNLLSLLHKLPPSLRVEQFYDSFFENLRLGLKRRSVLNSKSESTAVVTALVECLQYVVLVNNANCDLCEKVIKTHLLPLIEWSLKAEHVCYRTIFHQIALLVQYWNRNKIIENYPRFLTLFWSSLVTLAESVSVFEDENQDIADRQVTFMQQLKHVAKPKEQMKVKFEVKSEVGDTGKMTSGAVDGSYNDNLISVAHTFIKSYVGQIREKKSKFLLQNLFSLVSLFESRDFLSALSRNFESDSLVGIYDNLLCHWLKSSVLCSEVVVDLAFVLLKYIDDGDKSVILSSFLDLESDTFGWCVKNAFSHPYNEDPVVQKWLRDPKVGEFLVGVTDANLSNDCAPNLKNLFKLALTENQDGEMLIDKDTLARIIEKLQTPLVQPENFSTSIDTCAHLASYVTDMIYNEGALLKFGDKLLLSLFQFSCNDYDLEFLTDDTQWEISTSWQDVVTLLSKNLPRPDLVTLIAKFAQLVETNFLNKSPVDSATNRLIEVIVSFIRAVFNGQPMMITDVFQLFFDRGFVPTWRKQIEEICISAEYLSGSFANCNATLRNQNGASEEDILRFFVWSFIKVGVMTSPLEDGNKCEDEEDEEEQEVREIFYTLDDNKTVISYLLYDLATCQSFLNNYKKSKYFMQITQNCDALKDKIKTVIEKLGIQLEIRKVLAEKSNSESFLWCRAIYVFHQEITCDSPTTIFTEYTKVTTSDLSRLHLSQLYGPYINFDHVEMTSSLFDNLVILKSLTHCDEIDVQIAEVFEKIKKLRSENIPRFLLDNKSANRCDTETVIEVIRLFSKLITEQFDCLSRQHWDFGVICLSSWATNCNKLRAHYQDEQMQALMVAVSDLFISLDEKINELRANKTKMTFVEEWEDIFLPNIHADLLQLWLYLADQYTSRERVGITDYPFLQMFGRVIDHFVYRLIFSKDSALPNWGKILKRCNTLLVNSVAILQLWGYKMLLILVPGFIEIDLQSDNSSTPNTKGFTVEQFKEILQQTQNIVDGVLTGFKLGEDSCQVTAFTDSYTYVFAYLLLWAVLLKICEKSPPELRYQYADWLRNENYIKTLLNNLFKLMPTEILHYSEGRAKAFSKLFLKEPNLTYTEPCTSEQLEHVVCWIYAFCLSQLPALVRQWWSETETKVTQIVEKVTAFYVSPQLCSQELCDVGHRENNFKNMTIKIIPSVREVIAIYTVDEAQMELVITLPHNYPLGGPDVRCSRQIGGPLHKQWLMQLKKYLLHQNGRIWDGLALWNSSLDKKFDGVEECYICFAVLHPGTYQLPKLTCQTCKKKFHSACLYKWFSTSNKSSCPICRNLF